MNEREIFLGALEQPPATRREFVDKACGDDQPLRDRVDALLNAESAAGEFLEYPPSGLALTIRGEAPDVFRQSLGDMSLEFLTPSEKPGCLGTIGNYQVVGLIGQGGFGLVFRAYDSRLNRVVAIKVMAPQLATNPTAVKRFLREAQAAAAVRHDHVVTIHAIEESSRPPFIVMEFVDGVSLKDKVDSDGALELTEVLRIGQQIAKGLAAAHQQGLVHRDIKPANILLEQGIKRVKITDFGLARAVDDIGMTQTGMIAGTPQYMSPEQGQGQSIDARSDLFSLGSVLYTLCTGRAPFRADSAIATLRRVCDEPPKSIQKVNPLIPDWMEQIVMRLLAKAPNDRFQSADEVADLLQECLSHVQLSENDPPVGLLSAIKPTPADTSAVDPFDRLAAWIKKPTNQILDSSYSVWYVTLLCFQIVAIIATTVAALADPESLPGTGPLFGVIVGSTLAFIAWRGRLGLQSVLFGLSSVALTIQVVTVINMFSISPRNPNGVLALVTIYAVFAVPAGIWLLGNYYANELSADGQTNETISLPFILKCSTAVFRDHRVYVRIGLLVLSLVAFGVAITGVEFVAMVKIVALVAFTFGSLLAVCSLGSATHTSSRLFAFAVPLFFLTLISSAMCLPGYVVDIQDYNKQFVQLVTVIFGVVVLPIGLYGFNRELKTKSPDTKAVQFDIRTALIGTAMIAVAFAVARPCMAFGNVAYAGGVLFVLTLLCVATMLSYQLAHSAKASAFKRRVLIGFGVVAMLGTGVLMVVAYDSDTGTGSIVIRTSRPVKYAIYDPRLNSRYINTARRDNERIYRGHIGEYEIEILDPAGLKAVPSKIQLNRGARMEVKVRTK